MNEIISFLAGMFADYIVYGPHRLAHSLGYQLDRLPKQWLKRFAIFEQYIQKSNGQQTTIGYPDKGAVDFSV